MAVVELQGKQFLVKEGEVISVPHLDQEPGSKIKAKDLLNGKEVTLEVTDQIRDKKVRVSKFRNKTRYQRVIGHRTMLTKMKMIEEKASESKEKTKPAKK
jgi:large subunit ribosomal protein L21